VTGEHYCTQEHSQAHIQASYGSGILEVDVPLREADDTQRRVPIMADRHIKPT
jgi:hypothetical protein